MSDTPLHDKFGNEVAARRAGPTRAYKRKVKDLAGLTALAAEWRENNPHTEIGITSGVFDLLHPGHIAFLNDARELCDKLVIIIASDRTVRALKGPTKPRVVEEKRAQNLAEMESVAAVIISDEFHHETVLNALKPETLFKGDDYFDQQVGGTHLVNKVILIPCEEKDFNSSSSLIRMIKNDEPDSPPAWSPPGQKPA